MNYYPFHLGDYAAHTAHLDPMEDLAYRRMLDAYYLREGSLPADPADVARLIRMRQNIADVEAVLREFFTLSGDGWSHSRCDDEIERMRDKQVASDVRDSHERERMRRHRERRAEMFAALRAVEIVPPWDVSIKELQRLHDEHCNAQKPEQKNNLQREQVVSVNATATAIPTPTPTPINTSPDGDGAPKLSFAANEPTGDNCPHQQIISLYHEKLPSAIRVREWTPARAQALRARWREKPQRQNLEWWERFFGYISESDFLMGRTQSNGRKPFEIDLEWICQSKNFVKIIEGKFNEAKEVAA